MQGHPSPCKIYEIFQCGNTGISELLLRGKQNTTFFFIYLLKGQNKSLSKKSKNKVVFSVGSYDSFAFPSLNKYINKPQGKVLAKSQLKQKQYIQQLWHRPGWESTPQYM